MRVPPLLAATTLVLAALAGCLNVLATDPAPRTHEIRFWVQEMDWEVHPNVTAPVWAFCAEGSGVEPVWDGPCGVPGPTIRVTEGDTIRLTFENTHLIPHTVHFHGWHGFAADMNGNGLIDESMVADPGETETIEWVARPAGTFIYHCHFDTPSHMEMGMYGAFIVEPRRTHFPPDTEFVAVLDEWSLHDGAPAFQSGFPLYNYYTINGKSFPLTQPWLVDTGAHVRVHMVNAGYQFHAIHIHGYTPDSWEGIAGPFHAVPTDVREIAPGQSIVLDFRADREGVWLVHDHVVPSVTAGGGDTGFGAYPRGMLTVLAVGEAYHQALRDLAPTLLAAAQKDVPGQAGGGHPGAGPLEPADATVSMSQIRYEPAEIAIKAGQTLRWSNDDPMGHTVTLDDGSVDSGTIAAGAAWQHTFTQPGTYTYHCIPHAYQDDQGVWKGMVGTITVE